MSNGKHRRGSDGQIKEDAPSSSSSCFGPRFVAITGVLTVLLVIGVIHVATSENKKTYFDELLSTGGAIRSARFARNLHRDVTGGESVCDTDECKKVAEYIKNSMNSSADPCEDFYNYVCGGWIDKNPIPNSSSTYSTFTKLNNKVEESLRKILEDGISGLHSASIKLLRMPSNMYNSCMDTKAIEKIGDKPLKQLIVEVGNWTIGNTGSWDENTWDWKKRLLFIHKSFTSAGGPLFSVHVSDDPINNTRHILEIDQAGPSLSREVYTDNTTKILGAYKQYIIDVGKLLGGGDDTEEKAQEIIDFEAKLASISIPDAEKIDTWFNRMTIKKLKSDAPGYDWLHHINSMFTPVKVEESEEIIVPAVPYLKKMIKIVQDTPKRILANYMVWNVIQDEVPFLSKKYRDVRLRYRDRVLGSKGHKKRWKTCVMYTNELVGDIVGAAYRQLHFNETSLTKARKMIKEVRQAFKDNVNAMGWMDGMTKDAVAEKANVMHDEVGYPSYLEGGKNFTKRFKKYNMVTIKSNTLFANRMSILKMAHQRMLKKVRKPVDKEEWPMDPQTINAMYSFNENEMIIPAGILQPPFYYSTNCASALSFGAIGSILGHEMTHGFDNTGRKFNKNGELTSQPWWSNKSLKTFKEKSKCIEKQYSQYKVAGKYKLNGKLTLGENIADNGGFRASLQAYHNWVDKMINETGEKNKTGEHPLPGLPLTGEQLFYVGFGQAYCSNSRDTEQYLATLSDHHSEEKFRVIGTLSNSYEFADAFKCKDNSRMNPINKCAVWSKDGRLRSSSKYKGKPIH